MVRNLCIMMGVFVWAGAAALGQASIEGLGDLPGGAVDSNARTVSADGSVVVGFAQSANGWEAFRWENGQMTGLGDLPGGDFYSWASGVSADGSVVVGEARSANGLEAFRWEDGQIVGLGDLPGGQFDSQAAGVSANGSVVVGRGYSSSGPEAFRWERPGPMVGLGVLPGGDFLSEAHAVSADGSVVVGVSSSGIGFEAFMWRVPGLVTPLGDLPGVAFHSGATGVSADGSVVVGYGTDGDDDPNSYVSYEEAVRWVMPGPIEGLTGQFAPGFDSRATGVSADGSIIVGSAVPPSGPGWPFIWDSSRGMRNLKDVLVNDHGLDLTGWSLSWATDVSADGLTIVGEGRNPDGDDEGWIVHLPRPNDDCANATVIGQGQFTGALFGASSDGTASCPGSAGAPDVWYSFTAEYAGTLKVSTCGTHDLRGTDSGMDTSLSVQVGCPGPVAPEELGCNDDAPSGNDPNACLGTDGGNEQLDSALAAHVNEGQTVLIRVAKGVTGSAGGLFRLNVTLQPDPPANDDCAGGTVIGEGQHAGTLFGATPDGSASCLGNEGAPDVWYRYTPTCDGTLKVNTCGTHDGPGVDTGMDTILSVQVGCPGPAAPEELGCNDDAPFGNDPTACSTTDGGDYQRDSALAVSVTVGQPVLIRVSKVVTDEVTGPFTLNVALEPDSAPPANDDCANALSVNEGAHGFCTRTATTDGPDEPTACDSNGDTQIESDVWYCYTASCMGMATVDLCDSDYNTKLAVYPGCVCGTALAAGPIICADDTCGAQTSLTFPVLPGSSYVIRIGGAAGERGTGTMRIACDPTGACCLARSSPALLSVSRCYGRR